MQSSGTFPHLIKCEAPAASGARAGASGVSVRENGGVTERVGSGPGLGGFNLGISSRIGHDHAEEAPFQEGPDDQPLVEVRADGSRHVLAILRRDGGTAL